MSYFSHRKVAPERNGGIEIATHARNDWRMIAWEYLGTDTEVHPFDRSVIAAIRREVDPEFTPIVVRTVYEAPSGERRVYEHHALGFVTPHPKRAHQNRRVLWPSGPGAVNRGRAGKGTLVVEKILQGAQTHPILPGPFKPIGWGVFYQMKAAKQFNDHHKSAKSDLAYLTEQMDAQQRAVDRAHKEIEYRIDHDEHHIKTALRNLSGPDIKNMGAPVPYEVKPYVEVKGAA